MTNINVNFTPNVRGDFSNSQVDNSSSENNSTNESISINNRFDFLRYIEMTDEPITIDVIADYINDKEIFMFALNTNPELYEYLPEEFREDTNYMEGLFQSLFNVYDIHENFDNLENIPEYLKKDSDFFLYMIKTFSNGYPLAFADEELTNNKDFMLEAVHFSLISIQFASDDLKQDREFCLAAVESSGYAARFADISLVRDETFQRECYENTWFSFFTLHLAMKYYIKDCQYNIVHSYSQSEGFITNFLELSVEEYNALTEEEQKEHVDQFIDSLSRIDEMAFWDNISMLVSASESHLTADILSTMLVHVGYEPLQVYLFEQGYMEEDSEYTSREIKTITIQALRDCLQEIGYIDENGEIQDAFINIHTMDDFSLPEAFGQIEKQVYIIMKNTLYLPAFIRETNDETISTIDELLRTIEAHKQYKQSDVYREGNEIDKEFSILGIVNSNRFHKLSVLETKTLINNAYRAVIPRDELPDSIITNADLLVLLFENPGDNELIPKGTRNELEEIVNNYYDSLQLPKHNREFNEIIGFLWVNIKPFPTGDVIPSVNPDGSPKPTVLIIYPDVDYNNAFLYWSNAHELFDMGYNPIAVEVRTDTQLCDAIARYGEEQPIDMIFLCGHGYTNEIRFGTEFGSYTYGYVTQDDFNDIFTNEDGSINTEERDALWQQLIENSYIDENGYIQDNLRIIPTHAFFDIVDSQGNEFDAARKEEIFDILKHPTPDPELAPPPHEKYYLDYSDIPELEEAHLDQYFAEDAEIVIISCNVANGQDNVVDLLSRYIPGVRVIGASDFTSSEECLYDENGDLITVFYYYFTKRIRTYEQEQ
ncbi:DUF4116 domain-containing protein [Candidatus Margulisiibacteriota bacterium]